MRKDPSDVSEVVSQGLFGEPVSKLTTQGSWVQVQTRDGYSGWVLSSSLVKSLYTPTLYSCRLAVHVYKEPNISVGPMMTLPFGVGFEVSDTDLDWVEVKLPSAKRAFIRVGDIAPKQLLKKHELCGFAMQFLGLPYTWGGRSSFGYDCSGFVQMLYSQTGLILPRDARLQIADPRMQEVSLDGLGSGDLIFWGSSREDIGHVALYLGDQSFIHTTNQEHKPWLRVSSLEDPVWDPEGSPQYSYRCCFKIQS